MTETDLPNPGRLEGWRVRSRTSDQDRPLGEVWADLARGQRRIEWMWIAVLALLAFSAACKIVVAVAS